MENPRYQYQILFPVLVALFALLVISMPVRAEAAQQAISITGTRVNIRSGAGTSFSVVGSANLGSTFTLVQTSKGWYKIKLSNGRIGWVAGWLAKPVPTAASTVQKSAASTVQKTAAKTVAAQAVTLPKASVVGRQVTVKTASAQSLVNIRKGPSTKYAISGKVSKGNVLVILQESGGWYKVRLTNQSTGWIAAYLTAPAAGTNTGASKAGTATNGKAGGAATTGTGQPGAGQGGASPTGTGQPGIGQGGASPTGTSQPGVSQAGTTNQTGAAAQTDAVNGGQFPQAAKVSGSIVNFRAAPNQTAAILAKVKVNTPVTVISRQGDWMQVRLQNGQKGWIAGWLLKLAAPIINQIDWQLLNGDRTSLKVTGSVPIVYETAYKQDPNRLVVKILDAQLTRENEEVEVGRQGLVKVVSDSAEGDSKAVSLSLELEPEANWTVAPGTNDRELVVSQTETTDPDQNSSASEETSGDQDGLNNVNHSVYTVALDAGHGGIDPGAVGQDKVKEKDIVLDITKRVGRHLEDAGYQVVYTRTDDTLIPLNERPAIAAAKGADIFVAIHANSSESSSTNGSSTYYYAPATVPALAAQKAERCRLAEDVQKSLLQGGGRRDGGILQANFAVLRESTMPSILVETAYLSNKTEEQLLAAEEFREKLAVSIADGIKQYFLDSPQKN